MRDRSRAKTAANGWAAGIPGRRGPERVCPEPPRHQSPTVPLIRVRRPYGCEGGGQGRICRTPERAPRLFSLPPPHLAEPPLPSALASVGAAQPPLPSTLASALASGRLSRIRPAIVQVANGLLHQVHERIRSIKSNSKTDLAQHIERSQASCKHTNKSTVLYLKAEKVGKSGQG